VLTPAPLSTLVLDRVLARVAPGWARRRARARALRLQRDGDVADTREAPSAAARAQ
jgi:hypothetical protein